MLALALGKTARRFIRKLQRKQFDQIDKKVSALRQHPFPQDSKRLKQSAFYRVDVGEYRIIYRVESDMLLVPIIGKRNDDDVYRRMKRLEG